MTYTIRNFTTRSTVTFQDWHDLQENVERLTGLNPIQAYWILTNQSVHENGWSRVHPS